MASSAGMLCRSCRRRDRYIPTVEFSRPSARALKKKDRIILSFIIPRACAKANFINVDFPVPGFPLTQRNP